MNFARETFQYPAVDYQKEETSTKWDFYFFCVEGGVFISSSFNWFCRACNLEKEETAATDWIFEQRKGDGNKILFFFPFHLSSSPRSHSKCFFFLVIKLHACGSAQSVIGPLHNNSQTQYLYQRGTKWGDSLSGSRFHPQCFTLLSYWICCTLPWLNQSSVPEFIHQFDLRLVGQKKRKTGRKISNQWHTNSTLPFSVLLLVHI